MAYTLPKDKMATLLVGVLAIAAVILGVVSFTGLGTYEATRIEMNKERFSNSDVFDAWIVTAKANAVDVTYTIYLDHVKQGQINLREYLDKEAIPYYNEGSLIALQDNAKITLSDVVSLEALEKGKHSLLIEISGKKVAEKTFEIQ